jgi:hypothetical protein
LEPLVRRRPAADAGAAGLLVPPWSPARDQESVAPTNRSPLRVRLTTACNWCPGSGTLGSESCGGVQLITSLVGGRATAPIVVLTLQPPRWLGLGEQALRWESPRGATVTPTRHPSRVSILELGAEPYRDAAWGQRSRLHAEEIHGPACRDTDIDEGAVDGLDPRPRPPTGSPAAAPEHRARPAPRSPRIEARRSAGRGRAWGRPRLATLRPRSTTAAAGARYCWSLAAPSGLLRTGRTGQRPACLA